MSSVSAANYGAGRKYYNGVGSAAHGGQGSPNGHAPPSSHHGNHPGGHPGQPLHAGHAPPEAAVAAGPPPSVHHSRELLTLNVGGRRFVTLYETVARFRSSYFDRLVQINQESGKVLRFDANIIDDGTGAVFINRDGDLFAHVLQYMRDGKHAVLPEDVSTLLQIKREAEFFGLSGLREVAHAHISGIEQRREERDESLQSIRATVAQISQSLYVTNFARRN